MSDAARTLLILTSLSLLSCDGGGDGDVSQGIVIIDERNANEVSAEVIDTLETTIAVANQGGEDATGVTAVATNTRRFNLAEFARHQLNELTKLTTRTAPRHLVGATTGTLDCSSGTRTVEWDDKNNDLVLSSNDALSISFDDCAHDSLNLIMDGDMTISSVESNGNVGVAAGTASMSAEFELKDLAVTDRKDKTTLQGGFDYSVTSDGSNYEESIDSDKLTLLRGGETKRLSGFTIHIAENRNTTEYALTMEGSVASTVIGGSVSFATVEEIIGLKLLSDSPRSGSMEIIGERNTSILMKMSSSNITLDVDSDGDNKLDKAIRTRWIVLTSP